MNKTLNFSALCVFLLCTSCKNYDEVELPDLNTVTPSYEEVLEKRDILERQRQEISPRNDDIPVL